MTYKRKTVGKYIQVTVTAVTQAGAKREAKKQLDRDGEHGWVLVGATPTLKHPYNNEYVWAVSYRKRVSA
jgi:hypothetical protein